MVNYGVKYPDGQLLRSCFSDNAVLQTITDDKGTVKNEAVQDFVNSISNLPAGDADERIVFDTALPEAVAGTV